MVFGVKPNVFGHGESFGTIFRSLRSTWRSRMGCRWSRTTSRRKFLTLALNMIDLILVSNNATRNNLGDKHVLSLWLSQSSSHSCRTKATFTIWIYYFFLYTYSKYGFGPTITGRRLGQSQTHRGPFFQIFHYDRCNACGELWYGENQAQIGKKFPK